MWGPNKAFVEVFEGVNAFGGILPSVDTGLNAFAENLATGGKIL